MPPMAAWFYRFFATVILCADLIISAFCASLAWHSARNQFGIASSSATKAKLKSRTDQMRQLQDVNMKNEKTVRFTAAGLLAGGLLMSMGQAGALSPPPRLAECAQNDGTGGIVTHWNKIVFNLGKKVASAASQPKATELEMILPAPPEAGETVDLKGYLLYALGVDDTANNRAEVKIIDVEYSTRCQGHLLRS